MRLIATLPIFIVAGFGVGFAVFRGPQPLKRTAGAALRAKELTTEAATLPVSSATTDAKAQRLIAAALRKGNQIERDNELYLAIEAFNAEDFRRLVADAGALKAMMEKLRDIDGETSHNLLPAMIGRWLKVEPGTLVTWAPRVLELIPRTGDARGWILDALASQRPEEMLALVSSRKDATEREEIILRALRELTARDPAKARAWLAGCADADRRVAERAMRMGMVKADPLRAIELANSIEDRREGEELLLFAATSAGTGILRQLATTPMKSWMVPPVLDQFACWDPELAVELAMKTEAGGNDRHRTVQTAFGALAYRDPRGAIAKLEGLEKSDVAAALWAIGFGWVARDFIVGTIESAFTTKADGNGHKFSLIDLFGSEFWRLGHAPSFSICPGSSSPHLGRASEKFR